MTSISLHSFLFIATLPCVALCEEAAIWDGKVLTVDDLYIGFETERPVVIEVAGSRPELTAIYDGMAAKFPPLKIRTLDANSKDTSRIMPTTLVAGTPEALVLEFVYSLEAGPSGYDSVWAGSLIPLPTAPSLMTVCEVLEWQRAARKVQKSNAIGRNQIIYSTLSKVKEQLNLPCNANFDAALQDRIGLHLLRERGWEAFLAGNDEQSLLEFAFDLAGEWAALPAPYGNNKGKSRYHGIAGNRNLVDLPEYLNVLNRAREMSRGETATVLARAD